MSRTIRISGSVLIRYPRYWWQCWKSGWCAHTDGLGRRCWIRFNWPKDLDR
jgi:hypothetical protein